MFGYVLSNVYDSGQLTVDNDFVAATTTAPASPIREPHQKDKNKYTLLGRIYIYMLPSLRCVGIDFCSNYPPNAVVVTCLVAF